MNVGNVFFALCSLVALIGAVGTVAARNPIRGAVGLLATVIGIAGLFLQLHAEFLAAIQLIVYAGAVVVLFVFVIMLLGPDAGDSPNPTLAPAHARWSRYIGAGLLLVLTAIAGSLAAGSAGEPQPFPAPAPGHGSVEAVGQLLFTKGLVAFELTTSLLIVAVVGAIAVARARYGAPRKKAVEAPQRLFGGPVHPRDAGHPIPKESLL